MAININLPSQISEHDNQGAFPATGSAKKLYVAKDTNKLFRWDGSSYVEISADVASSWGSINGNIADQVDLQSALDNKVDIEAGKGLSTNDYTNTEKSKLAGIQSGAEVNVNADWNAVSGDAQILNKPDLSGYATTSDLTTGLATKQATLVSGTNIKTIEGNSLLGSGNIDLSKSDVGLGNVDNTSDANKPVSTATQTALNAKQDTLVSGTSIKTVNSTSLLGSGDVAVQPTLVSGTNIKTVNSTSLLGSGDVVVQSTLVSGTNIKTINGSSVLGSGDLTISGGASGINAQKIIVSGQYVNSYIVYSGAVTTGSNAANRLYVYPFIPNQTFTCDSLAINVTTLAVGGLSKILIYSDVAGVPTSKLYESSDLDCSTTGQKTASTSFTFTQGTTYWIGVASNSAPPTISYLPQGSVCAFSTTSAFAASTFAYIAVTYNSIPSTLSTLNYSAGNIPMISIRKA